MEKERKIINFKNVFAKPQKFQDNFEKSVFED
jgi:hypothetical protein